LAGFVSTVDEWKKFADAWDIKLREQPTIRYFKMSEAMNQTGEFDNWPVELCWQKAFALSEIIRAHAMVRVDCSIRNFDFNQLIKNVVPIPEYKNPYFLCFYKIIISVISYQKRAAWNIPCDFIFDEQGIIGMNAVQWWNMLKPLISPMKRPFVGSQPIFRNDKNFNPLQGSDMYAWLVRDRLLSRSRKSVAPAILNILENMQKISRRLDRRSLKILSERFVRLRIGLLEDGDLQYDA
jgi:hypothetical protein